MASKSKPKRLGAFICLIMGIIVLACAFLPIYTLGPSEDAGETVIPTIGVTAYDAFKALINKDHLLPENIESKIYDIVGKIDKKTVLKTSGTEHSESFKLLKDTESMSLYAYLIYIGGVAMLFSGALMVVFGLLGTLIRAKLFKSCNILFSLTALLSGGVAIAGSVLIGTKIAETLPIMAAAMSYFMIIPVAVAFISLICLLLLRNKRRIR